MKPLIVGLWVSLVGCASIGPVTPVAVSDVKSVSGTWEGIVYLPGSERNDVTVTIRDDGSYDAVSKTRLGTSRGKGHIVISDGRLIIEGERGRGIGTVLRNSAGDVVMKVQMTLSDNSNLSAELWRRPYRVHHQADQAIEDNPPRRNAMMTTSVQVRGDVRPSKALHLGLWVVRGCSGHCPSWSAR